MSGWNQDDIKRMSKEWRVEYRLFTPLRSSWIRCGTRYGKEQVIYDCFDMEEALIVAKRISQMIGYDCGDVRIVNVRDKNIILPVDLI